jgi:hypothetical protein
METLDYWRLCEEMTVQQAAALLVGADPSNDKYHLKPGYHAARNAIANALRRGSVTGKLVPYYEWDEASKSSRAIEDSLDVENARVDVASLQKWLAARGLATGFFFPDPNPHDYLDPGHPRYAPKLAAAVRAWMAFEDESLFRGKSPKQALTKWLREHAREFGLTDEDGKPNETGIEEAAKVSNWQPTGGAPKTPVG